VDSMVVIKLMLGLITPSDSKIAVTIAQIKKEVGFFSKISFSHVKRALNSITDKWAGKALELSFGVILKNGGHHSSFIP